MGSLRGTQPEPEALSQGPHHGQPDFTLSDLYWKITNVSLRLGRGRQGAGPILPQAAQGEVGGVALHPRHLEGGVYYSESDVNAAIRGRSPFDTDAIDKGQLRRVMVDYAMLDRAAKGTRYRRVHGNSAVPLHGQTP